MPMIFRDYMLSFLFLRYLSDNYESAVKSWGADYREASKEELKALGAATPLQLWYKENEADVAEFEKLMRRKAHYVIQPEFCGAP